jgi:hypothetical protein
VAARFVEGDVIEYVSSRPGAMAWRVTPSADGALEMSIEPTLLA